MTDTIEVYPEKGGQWRLRRVAADGGRKTDLGDKYDDRGLAIAAAREVRQGEQIVLLRVDGSLVGELDPPTPGDPDEAQRVDLTPASEEGEARG